VLLWCGISLVEQAPAVAPPTSLPLPGPVPPAAARADRPSPPPTAGNYVHFTIGDDVPAPLASPVPDEPIVVEQPAASVELEHAVPALAMAPRQSVYSPRFVTQTDERPPWNDCLWAAAAMLLDKWTAGEVRIDRRALRRASGDRAAGSRYEDVARALRRLYGRSARFSPGGGERLGWSELLGRLAAGGGAVISGDYGRLGSPYTRWDRSYAGRRNAPGHAVYVERYDPVRHRLWLMDPLGRGGYTGEWIDAGRVHRFIWRRNGQVYAMVTPAPGAGAIVITRSDADGYSQPLLAAGRPRLVSNS